MGGKMKQNHGAAKALIEAVTGQKAHLVIRQQCFIPVRVPGQNDIVGKHWTVVAKIKKTWMMLVWAYATKAKWRKMGKARVSLAIYEPNYKRDDHNVTDGAKKVILDAIVRAGYLKDDSRRHCVLGDVTIDYVGTEGVIVKMESLDDDRPSR